MHTYYFTSANAQCEDSNGAAIRFEHSRSFGSFEIFHVYQLVDGNWSGTTHSLLTQEKSSDAVIEAWERLEARMLASQSDTREQGCDAAYAIYALVDAVPMDYTFALAFGKW